MGGVGEVVRPVPQSKGADAAQSVEDPVEDFPAPLLTVAEVPQSPVAFVNNAR
jgi:hypothetical protein